MVAIRELTEGKREKEGEMGNDKETDDGKSGESKLRGGLGRLELEHANDGVYEGKSDCECGGKVVHPLGEWRVWSSVWVIEIPGRHTAGMKDGGPEPSVDLSHTSSQQPPPKLVLRSDPSQQVHHTVQIGPEVEDRHQNRGRFLDRPQPVERPFTINCHKPLFAYNQTGSRWDTHIGATLSHRAHDRCRIARTGIYSHPRTTSRTISARMQWAVERDRIVTDCNL